MIYWDVLVIYLAKIQSTRLKNLQKNLGNICIEQI